MVQYPIFNQSWSNNISNSKTIILILVFVVNVGPELVANVLVDSLIVQQHQRSGFLLYVYRFRERLAVTILDYMNSLEKKSFFGYVENNSKLKAKLYFDFFITIVYV